MTVTVEQVGAALSGVVDPNTGRDLVSSKSARNIRVDGGHVSVDVELGYPARSQIDPIRRAAIDAIRALPGVSNVSANVFQKIVAHAVQRGVKLLPGVKNIVAVASGKGGVGKSTTAVNLALALAAEGATVGMLDADIYGPSQPQMLGISGRPQTADGKTLEPMEGHGIQASSSGTVRPAMPTPIGTPVCLIEKNSPRRSGGACTPSSIEAVGLGSPYARPIAIGASSSSGASAGTDAAAPISRPAAEQTSAQRLIRTGPVRAARPPAARPENIATR